MLERLIAVEGTDGSTISLYNICVFFAAAPGNVPRVMLSTLDDRHILGNSCHMMATLAETCGITGLRIIAVDTWLGSPEFYTTMRECLPSLDMLHGYPRLYHTFVRNMVALGHDKVVVPLPLPSAQAYEVIKHQGVVADLVYIDAAHEEGAVLSDIRHYFRLLRPGTGVMLGDDYAWPGVAAAVQRFSEETGVPFRVVGGVWAMSSVSCQCVE